MKKIIIAIDGPAASGKSSSAKIIAETLGYTYIDTGAMYRAVTLAFLKTKREYVEKEVIELCDKIKIELFPSDKGQRTFLDGEDVSDAIRTPEVTKWVSPVSAIAEVRQKLVDMQRKMGKKGGIVMDGRDIGTVVFPNAELKIFLIASVATRAMRRFKEHQANGENLSIEEIEKDIIRRDEYDSTRETSPLTKAADAVEIDTSDMTLDEQSQYIVNLARKVINA